MFAVPLFHELNKTAQLNGVILIGLIRVLELCGLNSPEWKALQYVCIRSCQL